MAQYEVPQFIERETRLLGPLTVRQTLILGVMVLLLFILYFFVKTFVLAIIAFVLAGIGATLVFIQINGRPLSNFLFSYAAYFLNPKLYIWRKRADEPLVRPRFRRSKVLQEKEKPKAIDETRIKEIADILNN